MATDDQQRLVTGVSSAPATFTVPGNGQVRPKSVFAHYDGSGAASSFLPALKVTSDAGELVAVCPYPGSPVAAGASADISWFPRVAPAAAASPASSAVSWLHLHDPSITVASGAGGTTYDFTAAVAYTNDTSTFSVVAGNGVTIHAVGFYLAAISCDWGGHIVNQPCEMAWNMEALDNGMFDQDFFNKPGFAAGFAVTQASQGFPIDPSSIGAAAPLQLKQTTGFNALVSMEATIMRLTADYGDF